MHRDAILQHRRQRLPQLVEGGMSSHGGRFIVDRSVFEEPLLRDHACFYAWMWLKSEAAWRPRRQTVSNGRATAVVDLDRGQLTHSLRYMTTAWNVTVKRVRTILHRFETGSLITTQTGTLQTIITICNYDASQTIGAVEGTQSGTPTGTQRARKGHRTNTLNTLNTKTETPSPPAAAWPEDAFKQWYAVYPRKKQRTAAEKAFEKVKRSGDITFDSLMAVTQRYAAAAKKLDPTFVPYPASWLNAGSHLDEEDKPSNGSAIAKPERKPSDFTEADWQTRMKAYENGSTWPEQHWGPKPGKPDCLVPRHLLEPGMGSQPGKLRAVRP
jgi:hypothetical protein